MTKCFKCKKYIPIERLKSGQKIERYYEGDRLCSSCWDIRKPKSDKRTAKWWNKWVIEHYKNKS